jgi:hypothetical protein
MGRDELNPKNGSAERRASVKENQKEVSDANERSDAMRGAQVRRTDFRLQQFVRLAPHPWRERADGRQHDDYRCVDVEHEHEYGVVFLNDFASGDLFGGRAGFEAKPRKQGFVIVMSTRAQSKYNKQRPLLTTRSENARKVAHERLPIRLRSVSTSAMRLPFRRPKLLLLI